jgi:hypothetical protein
VNESTADVKAETQKPQNSENDEYGSKHPVLHRLLKKFAKRPLF